MNVNSRPRSKYWGSPVLFHNYVSPSGEQPEQRILAYKQNNQLPVA